MSLHNNWMKNTTDTDPRSTYVRSLVFGRCAKHLWQIAKQQFQAGEVFLFLFMGPRPIIDLLISLFAFASKMRLRS